MLDDVAQAVTPIVTGFDLASTIAYDPSSRTSKHASERGFHMSDSLLNVGLDNMVSTAEIRAIVRPDSLPVKQMVNAYDERHRLIDLTRGRKRRSVIVTKSGYLVLSPLRTPTLAERYMEVE